MQRLRILILALAILSGSTSFAETRIDTCGEFRIVGVLRESRGALDLVVFETSNSEVRLTWPTELYERDRDRRGQTLVTKVFVKKQPRGTRATLASVEILDMVFPDLLNPNKTFKIDRLNAMECLLSK